MSATYRRRQFAIAVVVAVVLSGWTLIPQSADACEPMVGDLYWGFPADGAVVPPDVEFFALYTGVSDDEAIELVDDDGVVHEAKLTVESNDDYYAAGLRVTPNEELSAGEYTLSYEPDVSYAEVWEVSVIVDEEATVADDIENVDVSWYRQSYGEEVEEFCIAGRGIGSEVHFAHIDHVPVADTRYRLRYEDIDEDEFVFNLTGDFVEDQDPLHWLLHDDVDCIAVDVVGVNGEVIDSTTSCEPDRCVHDEAPEYWISNLLDSPDAWNDVEGCGDEEHSPSGLSADDDGSEDVDSSESACAAIAAGPLSALWIVLAAMGLLAMRRWT